MESLGASHQGGRASWPNQYIPLVSRWSRGRLTVVSWWSQGDLQVVCWWSLGRAVLVVVLVAVVLVVVSLSLWSWSSWCSAAVLGIDACSSPVLSVYLQSCTTPCRDFMNTSTPVKSSSIARLRDSIPDFARNTSNKARPKPCKAKTTIFTSSILFTKTLY